MYYLAVGGVTMPSFASRGCGYHHYQCWCSLCYRLRRRLHPRVNEVYWEQVVEYATKMQLVGTWETEENQDDECGEGDDCGCGCGEPVPQHHTGEQAVPSEATGKITADEVLDFNLKLLGLNKHGLPLRKRRRRRSGQQSPDNQDSTEDPSE